MWVYLSVGFSVDMYEIMCGGVYGFNAVLCVCVSWSIYVHVGLRMCNVCM